jgi:hypothetical protein
MSSATRKKAWRSSVSQPRVVRWNVCVSEGLVGERREMPVSGTERPRFSLPPRVLALRDWLAVSY